MAIITLTTDLGDKDIYQAALKGSILKLLPTVNIVDITNNVAAFNVQQAAFILKNSYYYFPDNTVHLIGIDTVYNTYTRYLAVRYNNHFFVGADNGIFSLMFDTEPEEIVEINIMQDLKFLHFPLADIFVKAACHLANGGTLAQIGLPVENVENKMNLHPVIEKNLIKGAVIYIDSFQNVITNVTDDARILATQILDAIVGPLLMQALLGLDREVVRDKIRPHIDQTLAVFSAAHALDPFQ